MTPALHIHHACMREALAAMPADTYHACVTDPPYELDFMGKGWDRTGIAFDPAAWAAVYRVLRPGAHLIAFGGTRTVHRIAIAIEDAGFEIRDQLMWLYGSGFPKSLDISKAIDKAAGAEREVIGERKKAQSFDAGKNTMFGGDVDRNGVQIVTAPATAAAREWTGWGTALKPAWEPILLARKPLSEKTVAANTLRHHSGGLHIDACRIHADDAQGGSYTCNRRMPGASVNASGKWTQTGIPYEGHQPPGRFPANVLHDGSPEVLAAFASYGSDLGAAARFYPALTWTEGELDMLRFFYSGKATAADRDRSTAGNTHATVKPQALMRWLIQLVCPAGGHILDPFAGSGTTGKAANELGISATLIEKEAAHIDIIKRRPIQPGLALDAA